MHRKDSAARSASKQKRGHSNQRPDKENVVLHSPVQQNLYPHNPLFQNHNNRNNNNNFSSFNGVDTIT